jgi:hypothetical protein
MKVALILWGQGRYAEAIGALLTSPFAISTYTYLLFGKLRVAVIAFLVLSLIYSPEIWLR